MTQTAPRPTASSWQAIRDEVRRRIHSREWAPGSVIPTEVELAASFGCARMTVNRALQDLAAAGLLDRRRKGGTRVALHPVEQARLEIPVIRAEIEATGAAYGYRLLERRLAVPLPEFQARMQVPDRTPLLNVLALHLAGDRPYVVEDRWIDPDLPGLSEAPFDETSPNEWLLEHIPYTGGEISFGAHAASVIEARALQTSVGAAVFGIRRTTRDGEHALTTVDLTYAPGHRMRTTL
ncbi:GntR family transcriptional regulator [Frigidibacter sp. ROC022]|uniref:GntR family transcriptional regulator n=1 Tax=Frigidibacter sp. ROC022 TaxID=2971796 RepID=UPI00215A39A1|nr:GntR family transcriptional regulator [Frigidibacter sp. ROC022]MCR8722839.1 GntR family transcriptional regulator [Frigidibacter sp. ROC022]